MTQKKQFNPLISQQYHLMKRHSAQIKSIEQVISSYVSLLENPQLFIPGAGHINLTFKSHGTDKVPVALTAAADDEFYELVNSDQSQQDKSAALLEKGFPMQLFLEDMKIHTANGYEVCVTSEMSLPLAENDISTFLNLMHNLLSEKFTDYDIAVSSEKLLLSPKNAWM